ncbi:DUF4446 family protein [Megasphaera paucivorans]|uniref:DUF4446 domain-containing protein n=1 Tax=Megasphaera paucivorans TaxID=349095 RepID=A0A1G9XA23_9FIRM|nr:DUF4446 family protein [Megasphaera paucivorans]SDM93584.1 Protein of unknown function [Megasphaera paucivorans]
MWDGMNMGMMYLVAAGAVGILLLLLLIYIVVLNYRVNKLTRKYSFFMQDETGKSVETKLREDVVQLRELSDTLDSLYGTQAEMLTIQNHCFRKIGFVKYNAFDNIGNHLSFAFTILDGKNDGFCLSSVYGRNESRIFAKPIVNGRSLYSMSEEEKESLENALHYTGEVTAVNKE